MIHTIPGPACIPVIVGIDARTLARGTLETFVVRVRADLPRAEAERAAVALVDRMFSLAVRPARLAPEPSAPILRHCAGRRRQARRSIRPARRMTRATSPPSADPDPIARLVGGAS